MLDQYGFNFHTIGSGSNIVLAVLNPLAGFCDGNDLHQIVYTLCAAKFAAESDDKVGRQTMVMCIDEMGQCQSMSGHAIDDLRLSWLYQGRPPFPDLARDLIKENLLSLGQVMDQAAMAYLEAKQRETKK